MTEETTTPAEGQVESTESNTNNSWFSGFADEDLGYIQNKGWDKDGGAQELFKSYQNLEKLRGVPEDRLLKLPKEDDAEGWGKVYTKLGKPEKIEDYSFQMPEGIPESKERQDWFKTVAHEANLTKSQYEKIAKATVEYEAGITQNYNQELQSKVDSDIAQLKQEWGSGYEERRLLAEQGLARYLDDDSEAAVKQLQDSMGHAQVIKLFAKIGERISEPSANKMMGDSENRFGYTIEQAKADKKTLMQELQANPERLALYNKGKGADLDKMTRLNKKIAEG